MPLEGAFLVVLVVKNPAANAGDVTDAGSIPGLGSSPAGGQGTPLQYSYLENPIDRGTWLATVHRIAKSWTRLKQFSTHTHHWKSGHFESETLSFHCVWLLVQPERFFCLLGNTQIFSATFKSHLDLLHSIYALATTANAVFQKSQDLELLLLRSWWGYRIYSATTLF